jgi:hypothetical protein
MSHLTLETIARLVDAPATGDENAHLETCAACRRELEDMRADAVALAALPALEPPAGEWAALEARLAAEGLLRGRPRMTWRAAALRSAAAIVLFVLGAAAGTAWRGGESPTALADATPADATPATPPVPSPSGRATTVGIRSPAQQPAAAPARGRVVVEEPAWVRTSPHVAAVLAGQRPDDYDEAVGFYRETEVLYLDALTRMAEMSGGDYGDPYARLAALEAITSITRAALGQAPADPVINGYHVTALAQRDATLRQIAARTTESWF